MTTTERLAARHAEAIVDHLVHVNKHVVPDAVAEREAEELAVELEQLLIRLDARLRLAQRKQRAIA